MVLEKTVADVHANLMALHDEAVRGHENPLIVRLLEQMMRLTNMDAEGTQVQTEPDAVEPEDERTEAAPCKHPIVSIYGKCQQCGECQHTNVHGGVCLTCNEPISEVPA